MLRTRRVFYIFTCKSASRTSELQKVVEACCVLYILTCKCASRHSGVPFFHIWTSKVVQACSVLYILTCKCASRHSGVQFFHIWTSKNQKVVRTCCVLYIVTWKCVSRYSGVQFSISPLNSYLRTRRFSELTFRPADPQIIEKTQHFATSLTFCACGSSLFWLSRNCIFFLLTLLLLFAFSSSDSATLLCFFNCPYCRKLDF